MADAGTLYRNPIAFLNERMAYLQGASRDTPLPGDMTHETVFAPATRYEFEIAGISREDKQSPAPPTDARVWRQPFGDLLSGAYTYRVPVSYRITSTPGSGVS